MTHRRIWLGAALLAVAAAAAGIVFLVGRDAAAPRSEAAPLRARGTISPRIAVFGDTIRARVDVTLDRRRVDPDTVRVRASFKEWRRVTPAQLVRSDAGSVSHLRAVYVLRCLKLACAPGRDTIVFDFDPARVEYSDAVTGTPKQATAEVSWPRVVIHTRIAAGDLSATRSPYRADVTSLPAPSYRTSPGLLVVLLAAGALMLIVAAAVLTYLGWPRREPEPEPEPEPERESTLTPLEQALELLENAARANGAADQRRSLELVAEVLAARGADDELWQRARELAWSPTPPPAEATKGLAVRVRAELDEELRRLEDERRRLEEEAAAAAAAREGAHAGPA